MQYENIIAMRLSLETGWRIDDCLHLNTDNIIGRTATIIAMKTGKPDKKTLSADLTKRLLQIADKKTGIVFLGRDGKKPRTRQAVWKDVKKAAKSLKLDGNVAPHSARKTYGVESFKNGGLADAKKKLQHDDISTTMLYAFADVLDGKTSENRYRLDEETIEDIAERTAQAVVEKIKALESEALM